MWVVVTVWITRGFVVQKHHGAQVISNYKIFSVMFWLLDLRTFLLLQRRHSVRKELTQRIFTVFYNLLWQCCLWCHRVLVEVHDSLCLRSSSCCSIRCRAELFWPDCISELDWGFVSCCQWTLFYVFTSVMKQIVLSLLTCKSTLPSC